MRFRAGLVLSFLSLMVAVGCRKPLTPNVDTNQPPETWITQAPQDTITVRDENGNPIVTPIGTVPVRFHMYWAGSDPDGAVVGYYWAVVETLAVPPPGLPLPSLPGPRPSDYRFTSRTDSVFVFRVSEARPDRQHAFFIYAVDDKGKADATPARFIFNALDRFPPDLYIYQAFGRGPIYRWDPITRQVTVKDTTVFIRDSLTLAGLAIPPKDTIPSASELVFRWQSRPTAANSYVTGYRYKLDESSFQELPAESTSRSFPLGFVSPGGKLFTLKAVDEAGGASDRNRRFQMNFGPDSWFAGPDPSRFPLVGRERYIDIPSWSDAALRARPELQGTMLSSDSLTRLMAERPFRKTFYEIYKNRIYIRGEGDTVNMNSWILFHGGGSDLDSPYRVRVSLNEPALEDTQWVTGPPLVVRPSGPNGSPIGMQFGYTTEQEPFKSVVVVPRGNVLPVFDAASVARKPEIGAYVAVRRAGEMYFTVSSIDGDNAADRRVGTDPKRTWMSEPSLRGLIIRFHVDRPAYLLFNQPGFVPRPDTTFFTRLNLRFNLAAADDDPYDFENPPSGPGGPSSSTVLRWTLTLRGKGTTTGRDTTFVPPGGFQFSAPQITVSVPDFIRGPEVDAIVELCDCKDCETNEGTGRCVKNTIRFNVPAVAASRASADAVDRPGLDPDNERRRP